MAGYRTCHESRQVRRFEATNFVHELKDIVDHEVNPWMANCCQRKVDHEHCDISNSSLHAILSPDKERVVPRRYLDLGEFGNYSVKLVNVHDLELAARNQYLILSYCWGEGNATAKTTKHNLQSRYDRIAESTLPKTIQDAIRLTRLMGFRYLWIDAVCIVQSLGQDDQGEFEEEAKRMGHYYANAACCISASRASNSCEGFLGPRPSARHPLREIGIQLTTSNKSRTQVIVLAERFTRDGTMRRHLTESPLMQRGWYLQELLLAPRILHWTEFGLYRECRSSWFAEGTDVIWKRAGIFDKDNPRDSFNLSSNKELTSFDWYQLLATFSTRVLTFPEDRHHAILGIASVFAQYLGKDYVHGLFTSHLSEGLAWEARTGTSEPRQKMFPGWSWASNGPVSFYEIDQDASYAHIRQPCLTSASDSSVKGSDNHSKLFIRAPLIVVSFKGEDEVFIKRLHQNEWITTYYSYAPDHLLGLGSSLIEASKQAGKHGVTAEWLLLGHFGWEFRGMLVQRVPNSAELTYERYGMLKVLNLNKSFLRDCFDELTDLVLI